jgi:hypothetical protein
MPECVRNQPRRVRARVVAALIVAACAVSCTEREPRAAVNGLNWACGAQRCTASFRVAAEGSDEEALLVLVRAYAGDSVASREIVGEYRRRLVLSSGQSKAFDVSLETRRAATRLRVILERAD